MQKKLMIRRRLLGEIILASLVIGFLSPLSLQAKDWIKIIENEGISEFREGITFRLAAEASGPNIVEVTLFYRVRGDKTPTQQPVEIEAGSTVEAEYMWDLSRQSMTPFAPIEFYWVISDGHELKFTTEAQVVVYEDTRFPWKILETTDLSVRWYEGSDEFGQRVFNLAADSLERMSQELRADLDFPLNVILYAKQENFQTAFFYVPDWVGGRAYPALSLTLQIVPPNTAESWLRDVIPHEITHLYFYQATFNILAPTPAWLNEGLATYYELSNKSYEEGLVQDAAAEEKLIPLRALAGGFGIDEEGVRLSYAQSYSFVKFLFERYGEKAMVALLAAYKSGHPTIEAFTLAFGADPEDLENEWRASLGAGPVPTPLRVISAPTFAVPTPTPASSPTLPPIQSPTPESVAIASPAPTQITSPSAEGEISDGTLVLIVGVVIVAAVGGGLVWSRRKRC